MYFCWFIDSTTKLLLVPPSKPPRNPPTRAPIIGIGIKIYPTTAPPILPPTEVPPIIAIFPAYLILL